MRCVSCPRSVYVASGAAFTSHLDASHTDPPTSPPGVDGAVHCSTLCGPRRRLATYSGSANFSTDALKTCTQWTEIGGHNIIRNDATEARRDHITTSEPTRRQSSYNPRTFLQLRRGATEGRYEPATQLASATPDGIHRSRHRGPSTARLIRGLNLPFDPSTRPIYNSDQRSEQSETGDREVEHVGPALVSSPRPCARCAERPSSPCVAPATRRGTVHMSSCGAEL